MSGWQKLWQDPAVVKLWQEFPPLPQVMAMADLLPAGARVLDIGCGLGRHTVYLAARGFQVTATDNSPTALAACQQSLTQAELTASLLEVDMSEIPFPDAYFGGIVAAHCIHHVDGPALGRIIGLITRKLAPGGLLVWATPSTRHGHCGKGREIDPGTWVDEHHPEGAIPHHYCTEPEIRDLLKTYGIESLVEHERKVGEVTHVHWRLLARKL